MTAASIPRRRAAFVAVALIAGVGAAGLTLDAGGGARRTGRRSPAAITALEARVVAPPRAVRGTDDRWHVEYDLALTNVFTADVVLESIDVLDERGGSLARLEGEALSAVTTRILSTAPATTIPASGTVQTVVDVIVPPDRALPRRLSHRIRYAFPPDALFHQLIGSSQIDGPDVQVVRRKPIVVAPPLRGPGWIAFNACCNPSSHRSFVLAANGRLVTPEVFAIDWIQQRDGRLFEGDGSQNSDWYGHGAPIFAAAGGTVVEVVDDQPEVPPGVSVDENPTLTDTDSFGGNHVLIRIRSGVYALYGHLIPGSVRVQIGDRVRTGTQIGLLGNSGNTSAPHLHFGLIDGTSLLGSDSLPFVIDRFTFGGIADLSGATGDVTITGTPREVRRAHPLSNSISDFRAD